MAFTAQDVKALREKTGVGMMECKKALVEADGRIVFATPSTKLINFSFLATKSVSEFTSTTTPFLASAS